MHAQYPLRQVLELKPTCMAIRMNATLKIDWCMSDFKSLIVAILKRYQGVHTLCDDWRQGCINTAPIYVQLSAGTACVC
jgi:hypothetical protein